MRNSELIDTTTPTRLADMQGPAPSLAQDCPHFEVVVVENNPTGTAAPVPLQYDATCAYLPREGAHR